MSTWPVRMIAASLLLGCGAKQEVKAPSPVTVDTAAPVAEEAPDLSPVKRPGELVALARLARPRLFFETLAKWSAVPLRLEDTLPQQARGLSRAVLWEAPIDGIVALDPFGEGRFPRPLFAVSVGLKSLEEGLRAAESAGLTTRRLLPGVHRVGDFGDDGSCAMAASLGSSPARLVCGRSAKDVDALLPYATRGLPSEPQSGSDFELTLEAAPLQQRFGQDVAGLRLFAGLAMREVALDTARFDRALSDALYGAIDETINLFNDLDRIRVEARIDAARSALVGSGELRLKGESSWTAGTLAATKPVDVPDTLPRLPPGVTFAAYTSSLPAERYTGIGRVLGDLLEGFLEHEKLPEATRKRSRRSIEPLFASMPEYFTFSLPNGSAQPQAFLRSPTSITRFSEPSARMLGFWSDLWATFSDPALKRWVGSKTKPINKGWPKLSKKPYKFAGFKQQGAVFELDIDGKALASEAPELWRHVEKMFPPTPDQRTRNYIIVQPDGQLTYVVAGDDLGEMARVMAEHRKSEPGAFFAKPARREKVTMAAFFTPLLLARIVDRAAKEDRFTKALATAPNHGETPITFSQTVGPGMARFDFELPAGALLDASSTLIREGGSLNKVLEKH